MVGSHIIPKYYLEQFATKNKPSASTGHLWVYSKDAAQREGTPKSEGVENGYFGLPTPSGGLDESLETRLAAMEDEATDALVMAPRETFVWSPKYRSAIASYAGLLYARTKARRDATAWVAETVTKDMLRLLKDDQFMKEMADHYAKLANQPIETALLMDSIERVAKELATPDEMRRFFLTEILETARLISDILLQKPWQVWKAPNEEEFITSDNPLVTMFACGEGNQEFAPGFGFNYPGVLAAFPLNPSACLIVGRSDKPFRHVDSATVWKVNDVQILCMYRNVYSQTRSERVQNGVKQYGGHTRFGENAFLIPGDFLPMLKEFLRKRIELQHNLKGASSG